MPHDLEQGRERSSEYCTDVLVSPGTRRADAAVGPSSSAATMISIVGPVAESQMGFCGTGSGDVPEAILGRKRSPPFWGLVLSLLLEGVASFPLLSLSSSPPGYSTLVFPFLETPICLEKHENEHVGL